MCKNLYVGNLAYAVTDSELSRMFEAHGTVESARVIKDRDTGRSKGFGFVEMKTEPEAQSAIRALDGKVSDGRPLTVDEAESRAEGGRGGRGPPRLRRSGAGQAPAPVEGVDEPRPLPWPLPGNRRLDVAVSGARR